jgi:hypothetical protein
VDTSGRLLVGTTTAAGNAKAQVIGGVGESWGSLRLSSSADTGFPLNIAIGQINFGYLNGESGAQISANMDSAGGAAIGDRPTRLVFSTTADGASSPTERMRIRSDGATLIGATSESLSVAGSFVKAGTIRAVTSGANCIDASRNTNDGNLVQFWQDASQQGTISVSGTTVSYNGAHLSRWSQLPGGAIREEILRGTVLSNIDEMCQWEDPARPEVLWEEGEDIPEGVSVGDVKEPAYPGGLQDNEQLNRMKVSDVEGDKNVSGVFQAWDDDDDTYTDDFYCAMTGDFIIRIAEGVTVQRGDLLMSAGDGTAKPQDDDIIRSKTVAKVTSTHVTCTYDDGSYCVPCVLMAC